MLSTQAVKEFAEVYQREFGITLSQGEAVAHANRLISFYKLVLSEETTWSERPTKVESHD